MTAPVKGYADQRFLTAVTAQYGVSFDLLSELPGGTESRILFVRAGDRPSVLRVSPAWRSLAELTWAYDLAEFAAGHVPEALAPVRTVGGSVAFKYEARVVSLFPYVEGTPLDRDNDRERDDAARLLARLHRVLPAWPDVRPRPSLSPSAPPRNPRAEPDRFVDPELDVELAELRVLEDVAPIHADFYRGNVRCRDERIVALFDWDDARLASRARELAWSVWEFAQSESVPTLDVPRASRFLDAYAAAGGQVTLGDRRWVVPVIRDQLRAEARLAAAHAEVGLLEDPEYVARSREGFSLLKRIVVP